MFNRQYRERCERLEQQLAAAHQGLTDASASMSDRAALVSLVRNGNYVRFTFVRHGELIELPELYAPMNFDVAAVKRELLQPVPVKPDATT